MSFYLLRQVIDKQHPARLFVLLSSRQHASNTIIISLCLATPYNPDIFFFLPPSPVLHLFPTPPSILLLTINKRWDPRRTAASLLCASGKELQVGFNYLPTVCKHLASEGKKVPVVRHFSLHVPAKRNESKVEERYIRDKCDTGWLLVESSQFSRAGPGVRKERKGQKPKTGREKNVSAVCTCVTEGRKCNQ